MFNIKITIKQHEHGLICIGILLVFAVFFNIIKNYRNVVNFVTQKITTPIKNTIGNICGLVRFSVMEIIIFLIIIGIVIFLAIWIVMMIRRKEKLKRFLSGIIALICIALVLYDLLFGLWGINYYTDNFQDLSGIKEENATKDNLYNTTLYFVKKLNETCEKVSRNDEGVFNTSVDEMLDDSIHVYDNIEKTIPCLLSDDRRPKPMLLSEFMSTINYTGIFFPLTGESNINVNCPLCLIPATIAHELAHQRAVAAEKECNFIAVLSSTTSGIDYYEYSGWLSGFIYLNNALYDTDKDLWESAYSSLSDVVKKDLDFNNAYWKRYEGKAAETANNAYDSLLKSYGDENGIISYDLVVNLLVSYYSVYGNG